MLPAVVAGSAGQAQPFSAGKLLPWWLLIAACGVIVLQALALRRRLRPAPVAPGAVRSKPTLAPPGERYSEAEPPAPTLRVSPSADRPLPKPAVLSKPESELTLEMPVQLPVAEPTPSATAASRIAAPLISLPEPQTPPRRLPAPLPTLPLESAFEQRQAVPVYVAPLTTSAEEDVQLEVARVLSNALRYAPQRLDLRYKLLEIHHAKVQKEAFIENARLYAEEMRGQNDPAWAAIVNMGQTLAPTEPLFAVSIPGSTGPSDHGKRAARHFDNLDEYQLGARLAELHEQYTRLSGSPAYTRALEKMYHRECERPTTLSRALRLSEEIAGAQILVKREDLRAAREGQRLNAFGQVMLAKHLGKKRVVIGTRSGMFGEAMARAAHTLGLPLRAYMPKTLASNVKHPSLRLMKMLDVEIIGQPNADPRRAALRDWLAEPEVAFYATGLDAGPPPYPAIVVDLQAVIGLEVLQQSKDVAPEGVHAVVCPRASGVTSMGFMQPMMNNPLTALHCVDNGGKAITDESEHSYMREHAWMRATGRVQYSGVSMTEVYNAAERGGRLECFPQDGCNAATLAKAISVASTLQRSQVVVALFINPLEVQANLEKVDFPL